MDLDQAGAAVHRASRLCDLKVMQLQRNFLMVFLALSSLVLLIALNSSQRRSAAAELTLAENTLAAVSEAASELETMNLTLDKLLLTTSPRQAARLLSALTLCTDRVQQCITALPDPHGQQGAVLSYLSRLSSLCQSTLVDLAEGNFIEAETLRTFSDMRTGLTLLQSEMTLAQAEVSTGSKAEELPPSTLTAPPSALETVTYKALPSREVSLGEAMQIAKAFIGVDQVLSVSHAPDTTGALPTYGITVQTADLTLNLEITQRGGKVLLMAPETAAFSIRRTVDECRDTALDFLQSRGFSEMEVFGHQVYDGLCVFSCAYVQNGVLVWPDRVTIQVRMDNAQVVGLEARQYWKNHIPRKLQTPLLTAAEARASLHPDVTVDSARLCLIVADGLERLCWQFSLNNQEVLSFIDAMTGQELRLEKLIPTNSGFIPA